MRDSFRVITAPEPLELGKLSVFLGGGILHCPEWQDELIRILEATRVPLTVVNPRRKNFPMDDPSAAQAQIEWEYNALWFCDVFSMWFCATDKSDQPICFYELGRHLVVNHPLSIVVGYETGFRRWQDIEIQTRLVLPKFEFSHSLEEHAGNIIAAFHALRMI